MPTSLDGRKRSQTHAAYLHDGTTTGQPVPVICEQGQKGTSFVVPVVRRGDQVWIAALVDQEPHGSASTTASSAR